LATALAFTGLGVEARRIQLAPGSGRSTGGATPSGGAGQGWMIENSVTTGTTGTETSIRVSLAESPGGSRRAEIDTHEAQSDVLRSRIRQFSSHPPLLRDYMLPPSRGLLISIAWHCRQGWSLALMEDADFAPMRKWLTRARVSIPRFLQGSG